MNDLVLTELPLKHQSIIAKISSDIALSSKKYTRNINEDDIDFILVNKNIFLEWITISRDEKGKYFFGLTTMAEIALDKFIDGIRYDAEYEMYSALKDSEYTDFDFRQKVNF